MSNQHDCTNFAKIFEAAFKKKKEQDEEEHFRKISLKEDTVIRSERKIFVYGQNLQPRIKSINDAKFRKQIHENLFKHGYRALFPIQSHSWNEICSGRSVTIVNGRNGGKTFAFLPALLSLLSANVEDSCDETDQIQGPIALIITQTSREVEILYKLCIDLVTSKKISIVKAFGQWNFKQKCIEILNGCDLFITTPQCFKRFSEVELVRVFDKTRIKHLVFENLDLMMEKFKEDIMNVIRICTTLVESPKHNPQIIITATCWQDILHNFQRLSHQPVIIIGSYIEAALFSKTRFLVSRRIAEEKDEKLISYLRQFEWREKKTAVLVSKQEELEKLKIILNQNSFGYDVLDNNSYGFDREAWMAEKKGKMTLLLIHDNILTKIDIGCIQILIHYSMPSTWTSFSRRFGLSLDCYKIYTKLPEKNEEKQPRAIICLDDNNILEMPRIMDFLTDRRLTDQIPQAVQDEVQKIKNNLELAKSDESNGNMAPLCTHIIKFASCEQYKCRNRHVLVHDDQPNYIPNSGRIKFKLVGINSPLHYVISITHYLPPNSSSSISFEDKLHHIHEKLAEFQEYMKDEENQIMDVVEVGNLYGFLDINTREWRRCRVLKFDDDPGATIPTKAEICFIDFGGRQKVRAASLMKLPEDVKSLDPYVCELRVSNLVPLDLDFIFDHETMAVVEKHMKKIWSKYSFAICDIEMAVQNTIITKNVNFYQNLENCKTSIMIMSLKKFLLENKYVAAQEDIFDRLKKIAKNSNFKIFEKSEIMESPKTLQEAPKVEKIDDKKMWNIYQVSVGRVYNAKLLNFECPEQFYVKIIDKFDKMTDEKLDEIENDTSSTLLTDISLNKVCLFKSADNGKFFRSVITKEEPLEIFLVDYGTTRTATKFEIFEISKKFIFFLPFQAIECSLKGVKTKKMMKFKNALGFKKIISKVSKNEIFKIEINSKVDEKCVVSIFDSENELNVKDLILQKGIADPDEEEIRRIETENAKDHLLKLLEDDENTNLEQCDLNKMLNLPSTARFLPPIDCSKTSSKHIPSRDAGDNPSSSELVPATKSDSNENQSKVPIQKLKAKQKSSKDDNLTMSICDMIDKFKSKAELVENKRKEEARKKALEKAKILQQQNAVSILKNLFADLNIKWNQNDSILMLKIEATGSIDYSLNVTQTSIEICLKYADKIALKIIYLYGRVVPKYTAHDSSGLEITILLTKKFVDIWPRLTLSNEDNRNFRYIHEDLVISLPESSTIKEQPKIDWVPAGYYSDEQSEYYDFDDGLDTEDIF